MKHKVLNADTDDQHAAAAAAIVSYIERRGELVAGKGIIFTVQAGAAKYQVEVRSTKRTITAELITGHRRLTRTWG